MQHQLVAGKEVDRLEVFCPQGKVLISFVHSVYAQYTVEVALYSPDA